jgi:hypothetical protein
MSKAQLAITAVVLEGRSKSEVARDYDVSRYWVQAPQLSPRVPDAHCTTPMPSPLMSRTASCGCERH